jgi:hypothetical protein
MQKLSVSGFLAFALMLAGPASALAQVCVGMPIGSGQSAVALNVAFPEDATTFGASGRMRTSGPISVGANYSLTSFKGADPKGHTFGADVAYDLPVTGASICPVAGLNYSRVSGDFDLFDENFSFSESIISIPVGVGLGLSVPAGPNAEFVPFAMPHLLWTRAKVSFDDESLSDSDTNFGVKLGATYRIQQVMINAGVTLTSEKNSKALFGLGLGFAL